MSETSQEVLQIDSLQEHREILLETTRECLEADDLNTSAST